MMLLEFANWPVVSSTDDISVTFGASPGQVKRVLWSDGYSGSTRIEVETPAMQSPGTVSVEVTDAVLSVFFEFRFVDDRIELWLPGGSTCSNSPDQDYVPGYCSKGSSLRGTTAGGVAHTLVIKNFPTVSVEEEIAVKVGNALCNVQSVNSTQAAGGYSLLQVTFATPPAGPFSGAHLVAPSTNRIF